MSFEVYSTHTHGLVVAVEPDSKVIVHPLFARQLERISARSCMPGLAEKLVKKVFGEATFIKKGDPLYPLAVKMYCEATMLTHPESFTRSPQTDLPSTEETKSRPGKKKSQPVPTLNPFNKV